MSKENLMKTKTECICEGNWRLLVKEVEGKIGKQFIDKQGQVFTFFGLVYGTDDYYYGMSKKGKIRLLSCVGDFDSWDLKEKV